MPVRDELLPDFSAIPACTKLVARLSRTLAMTVRCSSQPGRLKGSRCPQEGGMSWLSQHPLSRLSPSRTAWGIMTDSYRPFLAAHPAAASALGVIAFSLTQALDKTGSLFPCKIYTHTVKASLLPFHLSLGNRLTFLSPSFFSFHFQQSCSCKTCCISLPIPLTMAYL